MNRRHSTSIMRGPHGSSLEYIVAIVDHEIGDWLLYISDQYTAGMNWGVKLSWGLSSEFGQ